MSGVSGDQLLLDQEISSLVTAAIKKRFESEGYQVLEGSSAAEAVSRSIRGPIIGSA